MAEIVYLDILGRFWRLKFGVIFGARRGIDNYGGNCIFGYFGDFWRGSKIDNFLFLNFWRKMTIFYF